MRGDHPDPGLLVTGVVAADAAEGWYVVATVDTLVTQSPGRGAAARARPGPHLPGDARGPAGGPARRPTWASPGSTATGVEVTGSGPVVGRRPAAGHRAGVGVRAASDSARLSVACSIWQTDWVWDFWVADDGEPVTTCSSSTRRAASATRIGATTTPASATRSPTTSRTWTRVADPLPEPAARLRRPGQWTGSASVSDDEQWWLFTTGIALRRRWSGAADRLCHARRTWCTWRRDGPAAWRPTRAGTHSTSAPVEDHWRDPWVVRDDAGTWHLYVTAQAPGGPGSGVVGHAVSDDLRSMGGASRR